jgi:DNA repair exonuclease SbcCD nuclease subunit
MLILHTGDWHIGAGVDEDLAEAVRTISVKAKTEIKPDLIVVPGDIYDGSSTPEERNLACELILGLADIAEVIIIKGNHDISKDLIILGNLASRNKISVFETPGTVIRDDCAIHCLPHFSKAGWIAAGLGRDLTVAEGDDAVSSMALTYLRGMISSSTKADKHLLYAHITVAGSRLENQQTIIGGGITFGYHDLAESGFAGGGFSHIHLSQCFGDRSKGSPEFRYAGSPVALNYGEYSTNKGFNVFDTDTLTFKVYQLNSVARVTLDAVWNGTLDEEFKAHVRNDIPVAPVRLRVKLMIEEGYQSEDAREAVQEYVLHSKPPGTTIKDLRIETQRQPKDMVRAQEIASAHSACQKLEAYWSATSTTPDETTKADMLRITREIEEKCLLK